MDEPSLIGVTFRLQYRIKRLKKNEPKYLQYWKPVTDYYSYDVDAALERIEVLEEACLAIKRMNSRNLHDPNWEFRAVPEGTSERDEKRLIEVMDGIWIIDPNYEPETEPEQSVFTKLVRR
jgi:hypothetical protein